ncbi:hypothetical protein PPSQR21_008950 [Paenibacillus polymyxa SQR-21]|nr:MULTISPECIES: hypothetical protein [Paenibacillus]AHM64555.1 hypothetical protein PPSQR21_008950 [Paenibacillus polymyxa SQR-21]
MVRLHEVMEQERRRMNELGQVLMEQSIPLSKHEVSQSIAADRLRYSKE